MLFLCIQIVYSTRCLRWPYFIKAKKNKKCSGDLENKCMHGANCPAESLNMHYSQPQAWVPSFHRINENLCTATHWRLLSGKGGATPKMFHTTVLAQTSDFHLAFVPAWVVASSRPLIISYYSVDPHSRVDNALLIKLWLCACVSQRGPVRQAIENRATIFLRRSTFMSADITAREITKEASLIAIQRTLIYINWKQDPVCIGQTTFV